MEIPCINCITLPICRDIVRRNCYSLFELTKHCNIIDKYTTGEIAGWDINKRHDTIEFFKRLDKK